MRVGFRHASAAFDRMQEKKPFFAEGGVLALNAEVAMLGGKTEAPRLNTTVDGTEIYTGRGYVGELPEAVAEFLESGRILLVTDADAGKTAEEISKALKGFGFRVTERSARDGGDADECCRLVLGAGASEAAEAAKAAAKKLDAECVLFPTVPCEDGLLKGGGVRAVFFDGEVLDRCPKECEAAGAGLLYALPVRRFEDCYARKITARVVPERKQTETVCGDRTELAVRVLESGAEYGDGYACDRMAELLAGIAEKKGKTPRRRGEYVFLSACALAVFYTSFLSSPAIDTLVPADHDAALDEIARLTGRERVNLMQAFDFFDTDVYFRINYILGEYRMDLLAELSVQDMRAAERRWRRIYDDAGYWLKSAVTARDVLDAMSLAGELSGGLLGYAAATGFLSVMTAGTEREESRKSA